MEPITVLSLFDGISGGQLALQQAGIPVKQYFASEVDKYAISITQHNFPNTIQLGDVREVHGCMLPPIDLLIAGSPCFTAETPVMTEQGYKKIADIRIGDRVLTHKHRFQPVLKTGGKPGQAVYTLKAQGIKPTGVTSDHPYYVTEYRDGIFSVPFWKPAGELIPDWHYLVTTDGSLTTLTPFKSLEFSGYAEVYNLEVAEDNSYTANNAFVHNCQGFSHSGRRLNFEDPRSKLFFEFVRLLENIQPTWFMLENVKMKKEWRDIVTGYLKVDPCLINSALVSAQNRERYYWANWEFPQPEDRGILLRDVLEEEGDFKWGNLAEYWGEKPGSSLCKHVGNADLRGNESIKRVYSENGKAPTLTTMGGGHREPKVYRPARIVERRLNANGKREDTLIALVPPGRYLASDMKGCYRKLTVTECERLQTNPDGYTAFGWDASKQKTVTVSNTQRYKALGNGWNTETVAHILSFLPKISD